jgi:hypothetical protein
MFVRPVSIATLALVALALIAACTPDDGDRTSETTTPPVVSPTDLPTSTPSPTQPVLPEEPPLTRGQADVDCVQGWVTPAEGSSRYLQPLGIIRRTTGVDGPLVVVDMRYFEGPESPPSDKGYLLVVQRWYVKVYAEEDLSFQGRFLVEARRFGRGVAAVAAYDTAGFRSPDWVGFQYQSEDPERRSYAGLPGSWPGTAYDFVEGGEGLTIPGLPEEVVGCLDGT